MNENILTLPVTRAGELDVQGAWASIADALASDPVCEALSMIGQASPRATNDGLIDYLDAASHVACVRGGEISQGKGWARFVARVKAGQ